MKYIVIDKFTNSLVTDKNGDVLIFESEINANNEALECQDGLVIPLNTDRLFTKIQVLDILLAFEQSVNPENFNSSENLCHEDFTDAAICKADELNLREEFIKIYNKYSNLSEIEICNYKPEDLLSLL